jgi:hypothetical protein
MDEYGFSVVHEVYSPGIMGNAVVVFKSDTTGIKIVVDRSQVLVNIGKLTMPEEEWFELSDIVHFYAPALEDVYVFPRDFQNNQDTVELQVGRLAQIIRQYCEPLLKGDFSDENQIKEIEKKRVADMLEHFKKLSEDKRRKRE